MLARLLTADDIVTELANLTHDDQRVNFLLNVPLSLIRETADLCHISDTDRHGKVFLIRMIMTECGYTL
jgi:hypothetical protein